MTSAMTIHGRDFDICLALVELYFINIARALMPIML